MSTLRRRRTLAGLAALAREAPVPVRVRGGCMAPLLADGQVVQVAEARRYWPGDVIVFQSPEGHLLAHRLLGYRFLSGHLALVTRGDACSTHDSPVPLGQVLGRVAGLPTPLPVRLRAVLRFFQIVLARLTRPR